LTLLESTFDPVACLRAAIRMTDAVARERRVALNLDLPLELPLLLADEAKVKKMIRNLAVVAIKTAPAGTSVDVAVRWAPSIGLTIDVADSGAPIEAGLLERALDPLHHANPNPTRKVEGFGIELAVVKAFADLHGVHLQMRPGDEIGNRATVIFPPERLH
jgi:two-component system sensor histidine kinase ResE